MSDKRDFPTLADRATALLFNALIFYAAFVPASREWLPTGELESVWLLSGLSLWLLSLLSAPWFIPPRDALANGIVSVCMLVTVDLSTVSNFRFELNAFRWIFVGYGIVLIVIALFALFLHDRTQQSRVGRLAFRLTGTFGRAELLYTPPALLSILGSYQSSYPSIAWLLILWTTFVVACPIERIINFRRQWQAKTGARKAFQAVGTVERIDDPNIVRIRLSKRASWKAGSLHVAALSDGNQQFVLSFSTKSKAPRLWDWFVRRSGLD